tara:strand:+ start:1420 stop:5256 length:3837 start_codon:yes stop_codon:yes gene_type:complete
MSDSFQNLVYECSRNNASVKIDEAEWINEFSGGITMNPGDTLRVLGSFIQEKSGGDTINVSDESFTINHQPYITAETVSEPGGIFQVTLGSIAEPVLSTDACGVEPPGHTKYIGSAYTDLSTQETVDNLLSGRTSVWIPKTTAATKGINSIGGLNGQSGAAVAGGGDYSQVIGWKEDLVSNSDITKFFPQTGKGEYYNGTYYSGFQNQSIPREFHISTLCKLVVVPLYTHLHAFHTTGEIFNSMQWPNYETGLPWNAGDYVATYYISGFDSTYIPLNNNGLTRNVNDITTADNTITRYGYPRYGVGPQSVVGKVLATQGTSLTNLDPDGLSITTHEQFDLNGEATTPGTSLYGVMKCYIWDFVNPAAYKSQNNDTTYPRHGSTEFKNGYSNYPNNNRLNGVTMGGLFDYNFNSVNNYQQQMRAYQKNLTRFTESPTHQTEGNLGFDSYQQTNMPNSSDKDKIFGESNTGLSFLWSACGNNYTAFSYSGNKYESGVNPDIGGGDYYPGGKREQFSSWTSKTDADTFVWLGQPFYNESWAFNDGTETQPELRYRRRRNQKLTISSFTNIGALVKVNIENDNEPHADYVGLQDNEIPFLGIPFTQQTATSEYKTAYQSLPTAGEQIMGIRCGTTSKNVGYNVTNQREPWVSGWDNSVDWDITTVIGTLNPGLDLIAGSWGNANAFNDSNCSIHVQTPMTGNTKILTTVDPVWNTDLHIVKEYKTQLKLPTGNYQISDFATKMNEQLHMDRLIYKKEIGNYTTVGIRERAMASNPSIINGNFLMSFLPDITYGFVPLTADTIKELGVDKSQAIAISDIPQILDGIDRGNAIENSYNFQVYSFPYTSDNVGDDNYGTENCMFRLIGGKLNYLGSANSASQTDIDFVNGSFSSRVIECKNDMITQVGGDGQPSNGGFAVTRVLYPTRTQFNSLTYGGSAKIFCGCPNPTFSWDENENKFYFEFLYTPFRPTLSEDTGNAALSAGDSLPSISINTSTNGEITGEYGGVYIHDLADTPITTNNTYDDYLDRPNNNYYQYLNDDNNLLYRLEGQTFWDQIGFSLATQATWDNYNIRNPYIFMTRNNIRGEALRNYPVIDIAINASNPYKSLVSPFLPQNEFFVQVDSDEFLADNPPSLSDSPFYLIGSDLPTKHYYGGKGNKLPIIGICGRNYARFSYVFDLSESSIQYRAEEKVTINSIHTVIYTNDYKKATNLYGSSSVIYVIQRNNYAPELPQDQLIEAVTKYAQKNQEPKIPNNYYYYENQLKYGAVDYEDTETEAEADSTTD